jgi:hypothetical protein
MRRQLSAVAVWSGLVVATVPIHAVQTRGRVAAGSNLLALTIARAAPAVQTAQPPAPAPIKPSDVASVLGTWVIPLDTPRGPVVANLSIKVEAGKVVAGLSSAHLPEERITDITKSGDVITLKASKDYHGPLSSYQGLVTMVLTLTPKGKDLAAFFDFNYSTIQLPGTATRKK